MTSEAGYLVQCISGDPLHIMEVVPGTALEELCKQRAVRGLIDAMALSTDDCPSCVDEYREREERMLNMLGCPLADIDGNCEDSCPCKQSIPDSPYTDQVRGLPITAV